MSRSEVSLVSAMCSHPLLRELARSSKPEDRALANKIIKTAACLLQITANRGAYSAPGGKP
jgi:hypothetical protein